jgi:hypothetical protein
MPVAGSNSIAIAAACHPRSGEERAGENSVMWGAFRECVRLEGHISVGHCGFSAEEVDEPQPAVMYE